jgi:hypothetical protein
VNHDSCTNRLHRHGQVSDAPKWTPPKQDDDWCYTCAVYTPKPLHYAGHLCAFHATAPDLYAALEQAPQFLAVADATAFYVRHREWWENVRAAALKHARGEA